MSGVTKARNYDDDGFVKRAACICVNEDETQVLLVSSRRDSGLWIVPGGGLEVDEAAPAAALREVREEAGVSGRLGRCLGVFENSERGHRTSVYILVVKEELAEWQEAKMYGRKRKWFNLEEAVEQLAKHKPVQSTYLSQLLPPHHTTATPLPHHYHTAEMPLHTTTTTAVPHTYLTTTPPPHHHHHPPQPSIDALQALQHSTQICNSSSASMATAGLCRSLQSSMQGCNPTQASIGGAYQALQSSTQYCNPPGSIARAGDSLCALESSSQGCNSSQTSTAGLCHVLQASASTRITSESFRILPSSTRPCNTAQTSITGPCHTLQSCAMSCNPSASTTATTQPCNHSAEPSHHHTHSPVPSSHQLQPTTTSDCNVSHDDATSTTEEPHNHTISSPGAINHTPATINHTTTAEATLCTTSHHCLSLDLTTCNLPNLTTCNHSPHHDRQTNTPLTSVEPTNDAAASVATPDHPPHHSDSQTASPTTSVDPANDRPPNETEENEQSPSSKSADNEESDKDSEDPQTTSNGCNSEPT